MCKMDYELKTDRNFLDIIFHFEMCFLTIKKVFSRFFSLHYYEMFLVIFFHDVYYTCENLLFVD